MEIIRRSGCVFYVGARDGGLARCFALRGDLQFRSCAHWESSRVCTGPCRDKFRPGHLYYDHSSVGVLVIS